MANMEHIHEGMPVYGADNRYIGTIEEAHDRDFLVNGRQIPISKIARVDQERIYLADTGEQYFGGAGEGAVRVPIVEEHLDVEKRRGQTGEVRINRSVEQERQEIPVELRQEEVDVDTRKVDERPLRGDEAEHAFESGTIRVPVYGEQAVVEKEAVVTGEVVVDKDTTTRRETVSDTVRRTKVDIDKDFNRFRGDFQKHFEGRGLKGRTWEQAEPNYRMGLEAGYDERYAGRDWTEVEPELRRNWETQGRSGDSWEQLREEIREGWRRVRR